ncbi:hypothetical protein CU098_001313, partial [Rhizopus stolonifer]
MSDIRLSNDGPRWIERIKQIFSRSDEQQPLLGKPKKSKKWIISVISLAAALSLLGVTIGYWVHHHDTVNVPGWKHLTPNEQAFLDLPSTQTVRDYLQNYTSQAHLAGTQNDKDQAEWTRDQFTRFGLNATIDTYWPLLNYPISHRFALISGPK